MGDKVGDKLNLTQKRMLELIRDNPSITQPTLMIELRLGKTAVQNIITFLRKNGYINRIGSNKSGYWEAIGEKE
ncbi:MAG: winged helix-turn-helix transcriptional regulator [Bacilli bacterium]|nr:winged helix-turn-helix transcriptional regulator [Bacilli bacterium]